MNPEFELEVGDAGDEGLMSALAARAILPSPRDGRAANRLALVS